MLSADQADGDGMKERPERMATRGSWKAAELATRLSLGVPSASTEGVASISEEDKDDAVGNAPLPSSPASILFSKVADSEGSMMEQAPPKVLSESMADGADVAASDQSRRSNRLTLRL